MVFLLPQGPILLGHPLWVLLSLLDLCSGEAQAVLGPSSLSLLSPYVISSNTIQMLMWPKYITLDLTSTYIV